MVRKKKPLSPKEERAAKSFFTTLAVRARKTDQPLIVAMVGLVGFGKSTVSRELVKLTTATVVESNAIRVHLRQEGAGYDNVWQIMESVVIKVLQESGNVILDVDFVDPKERAGLRALAQKFKARVVYIRVTCQRDILIGRLINADYSEKDLFGGASTPWKGSSASERGRVVALREMWRRTPHHYRWTEKGGGTWRLKKLPVKFFTEVDTTDERSWRTDVQKIAKKLLAM